MKKLRNKIVVLILLCITALCITIIAGENLKMEEPIKIIYIPKIIDETNEFWSALIGGANMAAKEYGAELTIVAPNAENDYERQNELIQWAIEQKPDAIAVSPANFTESTEMVKKVTQNNIKLILIDSNVDEAVEDVSVSTNNYEAGKKIGQFMKQFIQKDTKIAVVGHVKTASTAIEREKGLRAALGKDESKILEVVFCDSVFGKAYEVTVDLFKKYPDISMVAGLNEYSAVGAARAIKDMGLVEQVKIIGFDSSAEEIELLEEGVFQGIVIQKSFNMGYLGIEKAVKAVRWEKVPKNVDSGSQLITKENMYTEENQKLLFPFIGNQSTQKDEGSTD